MDYEATLNQLYSLERFGMKLGLENMERLLGLIGDPHRGLRAIHVTGSNGKGSVSAYVASVLREAGYRVGLYTSPHIVRFNERIQVDGVPISDDDVLRLWSGLQPAIHALADVRAVNRPTFFEVTTAMAFQYFRESRVDVAVIEVGMGGRLDATNVVDGFVAVITRIDLEHTEHLGKTIPRIAREKAGIIKPGARAVTVAQEALPTIQARCQELAVPLSVVGKDILVERIAFDRKGEALRLRTSDGELHVHSPLLGAFQVENAALAVATLRAAREAGLAISDANIAAGLASVRWPGRLQILQDRPLVVADGGHNGAAARALAGSLVELFPGRSWRLVIGVLSDKDLDAIAAALGPLAARIHACRSTSHRAYSAEEVASAFRRFGEAFTHSSVAVAIDAALADAAPEDLVLIAGSIYTVGEAFEHLGIRP
jgi:dihydrofolate synthase / folylpolyglutamate synthase